jgi:hypothetical protein
MRKSLDVRKMIVDTNYFSEGSAKVQLQHVYDWLEGRATLLGVVQCTAAVMAAAVAEGFKPMLSFEETWTQYVRFANKLHSTFAVDAHFAHWKGASGTVILADVWKYKELHNGCGDILYLIAHMASKSMCEAVIEGMGGVWSDCSGDKRHLSLQASAEEAMLSWSAPQPWHPEAVPFIKVSVAGMF